LSLSVISITVLILSGCGQDEIVEKKKMIMGTWVDVKMYDSFRSKEESEDFIDKAFLRMENIDHLMSRFRDDSEVSLINRSKVNEPIKVSGDLLSLINKADKLSIITDGAFDITIAPLLRLWGFYDDSTPLAPTDEEIQKTLILTGHGKILIDREYGFVGFREKGMEIDLSGIAKGFAVDQAINTLKREGVRSALVDAGGDIYCLGSAPEGKPWKVGLKHPRKNTIMTVLTLKDIAVATSGDYENFKEFEEEHFSHIINPRTGYPVRQSPISVTVLARDCTTADGLATALSVLGSKMGLLLVNQLPDVEAILVLSDNGEIKIETSEGLNGLYKFKK